MGKPHGQETHNMYSENTVAPYFTLRESTNGGTIVPGYKCHLLQYDIYMCYTKDTIGVGCSGCSEDATLR